MNIRFPERLTHFNTIALVECHGGSLERVERMPFQQPESMAAYLADCIAEQSFRHERVVVYVWEAEEARDWVVPHLSRMRPGSWVELRPLEPVAADYNRRLTLFKWRYRKLVRETGFDIDGYDCWMADERGKVASN